MSGHEHAQGEWETYWKETSRLATQPEADSRSIWDVEAAQASAKDIARFQAFMKPALPLVDLGCGSGIQTRCLAQHFPRVIGVDVSPSAVALAAQSHPHPTLQYRVLDVFDAEAVQAFRAEMGEVNIYMRTLLHLVQPAARARFAASIETLLGRHGVLYLYELGAAAGEYFQAWIHRNGMPVSLQRILKTGIQPGTVSREHVLAMFSPERFTVLADGEVMSAPVPVQVLGPSSTAALAQEAWAPPGYFMVLKPREP
ncbi:class I SAM-dependent methyltransferase [Stigmatella aurantiaca]|uniref:Thiopurine S-methyltransferase (Tpmt) superfamily n=1 Tax=Stigmatella aurantiaca (strain DW4/3-1) TaxID=378806 RepID=Q08PM7_STIAD|nr:class I SAM-dependent methyltransferase [Stigmatella aurantiaca]ADO71373.1 Thiopurine S-methyltransferase (Tpmt) superfamily [Stigmatella aurantiaca DW4/3-1]EAU62433.1 thiopurine S-methyltransferase (tpmt) superfamily [Stigmatella aurantiaca DW4/3-1]